MLTRSIASALLVGLCLVAGCGDTQANPEPTQSTSTEADGDRDEQPDTYNDDDNDGKDPAEG
jgi:hypothetical protein